MTWRPASGYMTKSKRPKWRCWNESAVAGKKEHLQKNGKVWLCNSYEAALRKCTELNK